MEVKLYNIITITSCYLFQHLIICLIHSTCLLDMHYKTFELIPTNIKHPQSPYPCFISTIRKTTQSLATQNLKFHEGKKKSILSKKNSYPLP